MRLLNFQTWPRGYKHFSCSTQLSIKFLLLINIKMPTNVGILIFMSRQNNILCLSEPKTSRISWYIYTYEPLKLHAQLSWAWKKNITSGPDVQKELYVATCLMLLCMKNLNNGKWGYPQSPSICSLYKICKKNNKLHYTVITARIHFYVGSLK